MKYVLVLLVAVLSLNAYVTAGDCETDNGKRISNCVIKGE
jgi:hypothetical protein